MNEVSAQGSGQSMPEPVRGGVVGALRDIFGQFARRVFWKKVAEDLVQAAIHAFFIALGQSFIRVGTKGGAVDTLATNIASKAFGAQAPSTPTYGGNEYRPASGYVPPGQRSGHPTFPGF